jgi:hypothetical protein
MKLNPMNSIVELNPPKMPTNNSTMINVLRRFVLKYFEIYEPTPIANKYTPITVEN